MYIKPKVLRPGNTIGIVSPAGPIVKDSFAQFEAGVDSLKKLGYRVVSGKNAYSQNYYLAGTDRQRADDLMEMFENPDIDAVICSRGGYGTQRLSEYIDMDVIRNNPKIFVGYSDITFLLNAVSQQTGLCTFHGPMVKDFNANKSSFNLNLLFRTITGRLYPGYIPQPQEGKAKIITPGRAAGTLAGGNLTTIVSTLGTKFEIDTKDKILFIEEINEDAYKIDRMLTMLKLAKKFEQASGFILGDFTDCSESYERNSNDIIMEFIQPLEKPSIRGFKSGHGFYNITLPIGANVELNAYNAQVKVLDSVVLSKKR